MCYLENVIFRIVYALCHTSLAKFHFVCSLPTDIYGEFVDEINENDDDAAEIGQRQCPQTFKHRRSKSTCSRESTGSRFKFNRLLAFDATTNRIFVYKIVLMFSSGSSQTTRVSERWFDNHFKCDECPSVCSSVRSLKEHVNKYHTRKEFECPVCQCGYQRASGLQSHIQSLHPDLDVAKIEDPRRSLKQMKVWALQRENLALKRKIDDNEKLAKGMCNSIRSMRTMSSEFCFSFHSYRRRW